jgi:hypothetical protein
MPLLSRSFSVLQVKGNQFSSKPNGPLTQTQVIFWGNIPHFFSEISYNYTKGEGAPLPHRTQPETKKQKQKQKEKKFTFAFWKALLDLPQCPPEHAGQMISCNIMFSISGYKT